MPKVGDKVYKLEHRRGEGPCVISEEITGETSRSWVFGPEWRQSKLPKKGFPPAELFLLEAEAKKYLAERQWMQDHGENIGKIVWPRYGKPTLSYYTLRKVAELIGYKEAE